MTDPEPDGRAVEEVVCRRWQPWWAGDRARVQWTLVMSSMWTGLALLESQGADGIAVINWGLLATLGWVTGLTGLVLLRLRRDLAALRRRPNTPAATGCILAAAVTGVAGLAALEISVPHHTTAGLAWFAAGLIAGTAFGITAHRLNNRAEAHGRSVYRDLTHHSAPPPR